MNDVYVKMIIDEKNRLGIPTTELCEGIYSADMFYLVEKGQRSMDRVTAKRLLARLGVDSGNYEHYLDYPDYEVWKSRMRIINCIEDGKLAEAEELLSRYSIDNICRKNKSRLKIENQFYIFMQIQIMKHKYGECNDIRMYEEALKTTVPHVEKKELKKLWLSPLEFVLVFEYCSRKYCEKSMSLNESIRYYDDFFEYTKSSHFGKVPSIKVYPKIFVGMCKNICSMLPKKITEDTLPIYNKIWLYCEEALSIIKDRKLMYYLTEILEIRLELLHCFRENGRGPLVIAECEVEIDETQRQLKELKLLYKEYAVCAYMVDDCYLYRESGIYCINEVIETRREMLNISRENLADEDMHSSTIWRVETKNKPVIKGTVDRLFDRLNLFPSCVNTGIVTDKKELIELYEELRYNVLLSELDKVKEQIDELKDALPKHPINEQVLLRLESFNQLRMGEKNKKQHLETLKKALECTIDMSKIQNATKIFVTTEELKVLYLISAMYKENGEYEKAVIYIREIYKYCKEMEKQQLADGRMGIYELIMTYMASLYGDIGKYRESNAISDSLIRLCLKVKRGNQVHSNMYSIAWNNETANVAGYDYNAQIHRCIIFSRLIGDTFDEMFYRDSLKAIED